MTLVLRTIYIVLQILVAAVHEKKKHLIHAL